MAKTNKEVEIELNLFVSEINKVIQGEPDEVTGQYKVGPLLSEFLWNRIQLNVAFSNINLSNTVAVDYNEPHSKRLIVERAIGAVYQMQDMLENSLDKLNEMLQDEKCKSGECAASILCPETCRREQQ